MKAFVSWSGGKESVLSFYRTRQETEVEIAYFLSMVSEDGQRSRSHGISSDLMQKQASMADMLLIRQRCSWPTYEAEFKKAILSLKKKGVEAGIFGDIDLQEHRDWVEKICKEMKIKPILPLWQEARKTLLEEFTAAGFKSIVVSVRVDVMRDEWLGRAVDEKFVADLQALGNVDLCGEKGEYHTFVFDGPIFRKPVDFTIGRKVLKEDRWFLELCP